MYKSIFDNPVFDSPVSEQETSEPTWHNFVCDHQLFNGPLEQILRELEETVCKSNKTDDDIIKLVLHPPRIIRTAIDNNIEAPTYENWMVVKCSIKIGLDVYQNAQGLEQKIKNFAD